MPAAAKTPDLSLIICTRNRCGQLVRCFQTIQRLKFRRPWELIIVDNGSTDATAVVIQEFVKAELSFSGQAMTAAQIAKAIDYIPERTETALERLEKDGQVVRNEQGRWTIGIPSSHRTEWAYRRHEQRKIPRNSGVLAKAGQRS